MKQATITIFAVLVLVLIVIPAHAKKGNKNVQGTVIKVEQQQQTQNGGASDHLWIRAQQGEEMQLRMGNAGTCAGCVQQGDQVRAKVKSGNQGEAGQVQSMQVRRNGEMQGYSYQNGEMVQGQGRNQARNGSGGGQGSKGEGGTRSRTHDPGSAGCTGGSSGNRGSGSGGGGSGGGGSRGGGGG